MDAWMGEINIFNERYLKKHPLHDSVHSTYSSYKKSYSPCEDMLGHLRALAADDEFFKEEQRLENTQITENLKSIAELLASDISKCQEFISNPVDERFGLELYIQITNRYDNIIKGLGNGLYQYYGEQHFYDPDISSGALMYNLKALLNKMLSYYAQKYTTPSVNQKNIIHMSNQIFIVHGHDETAKLVTARTLEHGGFSPIILHEQANSGRTIIEKIETYTDVPYAVVLYTECDLGRSKEDKYEDEKYRARQNVVFEHGYLIGKLGRNRVCALVKGNVETPGDMSGVVYITMDDAGAWKMSLAKEMQNIGIEVDMNNFCK